MRHYTVSYLRSTYGRNSRLIWRKAQFWSDPLKAYDKAKDGLRPGESISTFWFDWPVIKDFS
jgi:hypothetical protein